MAVPLLPAPRLSTEIKHSLFQLADERMLEPARQAGYKISLVGATVLPQKQTIAKTVRGTWLFVDHVDDPTADEYGGRLPIPAEQLNYLTELDRVGVRPQLAWVGHQLPDHYREEDPIPRLVPPPRRLREKDRRLALMLGVAARVIAKAATAVAAAPLEAVSSVGLDPIIFGGVRHPTEPVVAWCVLCSWEWD